MQFVLSMYLFIYFALQVDFLDSRNISAVVTKGMADADNWVTEFKVVASDDARKWYPIITNNGDDLVNADVLS